MNIGNIGRSSQQAPASAPADARRDVAARPDAGAPVRDAESARAQEPGKAAQARSEARALEQQAELSRESVEKLVENISRQVSIEKRSLSFSVDDELGKTILKVIDSETDEVIRQIPSEELLRFAAAIKSINDQRTMGSETGAGTGLLIQEKA